MLERLVHDVGPVVADRAARQLDAVADDVVLVGLDRQRILRLQRVEPALRHRERVVAEVDLARSPRPARTTGSRRSSRTGRRSSRPDRAPSPSWSRSPPASRSAAASRVARRRTPRRPSAAPVASRSAASRGSSEELRDRALGRALGQRRCSPGPARPALGEPTGSACRRSCATCRPRRGAADRAHDRPLLDGRRRRPRTPSRGTPR